MKTWLYAQLMVKESWRENIDEKTREAVQRSGGISELTLDELSNNLVRYGKSESAIPKTVETNLKGMIREALQPDTAT